MKTPPSQASSRRRLIIAGLGAGFFATVAAMLGWQRGKGLLTKAEPSHPAVPRSIPGAESFQPKQPAVAAEMSRAWFEPYLNTEFHLKVSALTAATLKLIEVSPANIITDKDKGINYSNFSLMFSGPKSSPEESKVYRVEHGVLGAMDLFLSPVGKYEGEVRLEAIVTRRC